MSCRRSSILAVVAAVMASCTGLTMTLPDGFLELRGKWDYKATTADGAELWVREFHDPDGGTLAFWVDALANNLVEQRGYQSIEQLPVRDHKDHEGIEMRFSVQLDGVAYGYLISVFVIPDGDENTIRVLEFLAQRPRFDDLAESVHQATSTLDS